MLTKRGFAHALIAFYTLVSAFGCSAPHPSSGCIFGGEPLEVGASIEVASTCQTCSCGEGGKVICTDPLCGDDGQPGPEPSQDSSEPDQEMDEPDDTEQSDDEPADLGCVDSDGDGYFTCIDPNYPERHGEVDCDDQRFTSQPNGYEFPNNSFDDDCDGNVDEEVQCSCQLSDAAPAADMLAGLDLCDGQFLNVESRGHAAQFAVMSDYFETISPQRGDCMSIISTGKARPDEYREDFEEGGVQPGWEADRTWEDQDPMMDESVIYDLAQLEIEIAPPANARAFSFSFMFLTAEWPEFLCQNFNDTFSSFVETNAVENGEPTNISFDRNNREITVNVGFFELPESWSVNLSDTPFGLSDSEGQCNFEMVRPNCELPDYCNDPDALGHVGSGSGWLTTQSPIEPGERSIKIVFSIHDEGDGILDSAVILDDFKWLPYEVEVGTAKQ